MEGLWEKKIAGLIEKGPEVTTIEAAVAICEKVGGLTKVVLFIIMINFNMFILKFHIIDKNYNIYIFLSIGEMNCST